MGWFELDIQLFLDRFTVDARLLNVPELARRTLWLGCGLARLPALYGREIMMRRPDHLARAETLLGIRRMPPRADEMAIMISLRGRHPDSRAIAEYLQAIPDQQAIALTGDADGPAFAGWSATTRFLATTALPDRDTRFINIKGLIALSALVGRLADPGESHGGQDWQNLLPLACRRGAEIGRRISALGDWRDRTTFVVSGASDGVLARTWASLLGEAGLLNPVLVDLLDFTHGDHLAACLRGCSLFIILSEPETHVACEIFAQRFGQIAPIFSVSTPHGIHAAYWNNLFTAAAAVEQLSIAAGYGGLRPPKICPVHSWRNWHGN
jgi:hypothetical protein